MVDKLDLRDGIISYDTFSWLKDNNQVVKYKNELSEDLLQISFFNEKYIIDVGWYQYPKQKKGFIVKLIQDYDWDQPLFKSNSNDLNEVYRLIAICIKLVYKKSS